jgi:hypothetical protein
MEKTVWGMWNIPYHEHTYFHLVRLLRDPSFGYPEHSNWHEVFGSVLILF